MKRLVCFLLIIVSLVSLGPTALADDDVEALKKRIEELEAEIATKDAIIAALVSGTNATYYDVVSPDTPQKDANEFDDAIIIDGIKLEYIQGASKGGLPYVKLKLKMTNNYMPADGKTYADRIAYDVQVLDADGVIMNTLFCLYEGLAYGETVWAEKTEALDMDSISAFRIKDYTLYALGGDSHSTVLGTGKLSEPAIFYVEDIEINN